MTYRRAAAGLVLAAGLGSASCGPSTPPPIDAAARTSLERAGDELPSRDAELTDEQRASVAQAQSLGMALARHDAWATKALATLTDEGVYPSDTRVDSWITADRPEGGSVSFLGNAQGARSVLYRVSFPSAGVGRRSYERFRPPALPTPDVAVRDRARSTALKSPAGPNDAHAQVILLPGGLAGKSGWFVYTLAPSPNEHEIAVGGHYRYLVTEDGSQIVETKALSKSPSTVPRTEPSRGAPTAAAVVEHEGGATPNEIHVYVSVRYDTPLSVRTDRGVWRVAAGKITYLGRPDL